MRLLYCCPMTNQPAEVQPSGIPNLTGYRYVGFLGEGGTSSVYLYEQEFPARLVAVKESMYRRTAHDSFLNEADYLAKLSTHPYILTIHQAMVSQEGRECLILEYAPGGNCRTIMRSGGLDEEQTLDLGVRMASALYSAHAKGIVHRDVKPGNFLITDQGLPVLADFGISASTYGTDRAEGLSIPWSAPEVLAGHSGGSEASDIYSLGASLFGMLTGLSPFEYGYSVANEDQLAQAIMHRDLPTLRNGEAAPEFEHILDRAMAYDRDDRYFSALDFGRAMQIVQQDAYGHMTPFVGKGIAPFPENGHAGSAGDPSSGRRPEQRSEGIQTGGRGLRAGQESILSLPGRNGTGKSRASRSSLSKRFRTGLLTGIALLVLAVIALAVGLVVIAGHDSLETRSAISAPGRDGSAATQESTDPEEHDDEKAPVPSVTDGKGTYQKSAVIFTWSNPDPRPGDIYTWHLLDGQGGGNRGASVQTKDPRAMIDPAQGPQTCISVSLVRADRRISQEPTTICAAQQQG